MRSLSEFHLGWVIGIIEGEGFIGLNEKHRLVVCVKMTDEDVIRALHEITGLGHVNGPYSHGERLRPIWDWSVRKEQEARELIELICPFLYGRRLEQAQSVLNRRDTYISGSKERFDKAVGIRLIETLIMLETPVPDTFKVLEPGYPEVAGRWLILDDSFQVVGSKRGAVWHLSPDARRRGPDKQQRKRRSMV